MLFISFSQKYFMSHSADYTLMFVSPIYIIYMFMVQIPIFSLSMRCLTFFLLTIDFLKIIYLSYQFYTVIIIRVFNNKTYIKYQEISLLISLFNYSYIVVIKYSILLLKFYKFPGMVNRHFLMPICTKLDNHFFELIKVICLIS